jgi:ubiquinol-cytochrome c reductase cytochrome c subunit
MVTMPRLRMLALVLTTGGALLALVPSVSGAPAASAAPSSNALPQESADAAAGREVFVTRCSACHGTDGHGTAQGPSLVGVGAASADFELRTGRMPHSGPPNGQAVRKPPAFDDTTIADLVAFVASLGGGPAIPSPHVSDRDLSQGQKVFIGNCAPCHGATANGGAVGGGALAPPLDKANATQIAEAMLIGPGQMPVFSDLSDRDRDAVVTYVLHIQTAPHPGGFSIGGIGPVPEGFVAWVVGLGLMLLIVLLVARDWRGSRA